ncbi:TetR/AcrR family transcriptional regulator [Streptomyces acidiscabies]|uniref:TetR family transcriptional regulator n=1 Tax=Streptomyces acidiscabies TaxID=42234 RepID=A0A0L0JS25_9ACTN|nr:TetR/AcrR family transcriptional regulator [Streptomyces acidiscabies]KND28235.1 TetR family transcriptional regulator [Streptomyces acidiscabies]
MAHVSAAERRPQLIKAAIDLMTRKGVAAGSTRAIAAELGVAQPTVHYLFGTKEELYRAVMEQLTQDLVAQAERSAPTDGTFGKSIATLVDVLWQTVIDQPATYQLLTELTMYALRTPHLSGALDNHFSGSISVTANLITQAAERTGHPLTRPAETTARFFLAGFDGLTTQHLSAPDEEAERACLQELVKAVLAMA